MSTSGIFELNAGTTLAAGDVLPFVDISDATQSPQGSTLKITVANFFGTVPSPIVQATGTVTVSTPVYSSTQTWNAGAVAFVGQKFNVTDTASLAASAGVIGSLLHQSQIGGANKFLVTKSGLTILGGSDVGITGLTINPEAGGLYTAGHINILKVGSVAGINCVRVGTSYSAPSAMASGDEIGHHTFGGTNTTTTLTGAVIRAKATETWGAAACGAKLEFLTTPNTTAVNTVAFTLGQDQSALFAGAVSGITALAGTGAVSGFTTAVFSSTVSTTGVIVTGTVALSAAARYVGSDGASANNMFLNVPTGGIVSIGMNGSTTDGASFNSTTHITTFGAPTVVHAGGISLSGGTGPSNGIQFGSSAPGSLANGQMWWDGTDFKVRTGGATKTITIT